MKNGSSEKAAEALLTKPTRFTLIHLCAIALSALAAMFWADACGWGLDEAITYRQTLEFLNTGTFPLYGLINSQGFRNPNALVLFSAAFVALFKNPFVLSVTLYLFQVAVLLWCYRKIVSLLCPEVSLAAYIAGIPALLWLPGFFYEAIYLWAQSQCPVLLCVLLTLLLTARSERRRRGADAAIGALLAALPALHLSLGVLVPAAALYLIPARRRHSFLWLGIGAAAITLLVWVPWAGFIGTGSQGNGSHIHFRRQHGGALLFGLTPFIELWRLLVSTSDVPLVRLGTPTHGTVGVLTALAYWRAAIAAAGFALSTWILFKRSSSTPGRSIAWALCGVLAIFSLLGFAGWAPFSVRSDVGAMFIPAVVLLGTVACVTFLSSSRRQWTPVLVTLAVAQTLLCAVALQKSYADIFALNAFTPYDIPVKAKLSAAGRLIDESKGTAHATVAYAIPAFYTYLGWVSEFQDMDEQKFYRPEILPESWTGVLAPGRLRFVDTLALPDFIIKSPKSAADTMRLTVSRGTARYRKLFNNEFLDLWKIEPGSSGL